MLADGSLRQILMASLPRLYSDHPVAALKLASSFLHTAFQKYISPYFGKTVNDSDEQVRAWIQGTDLLMQGILVCFSVIATR
jgi:hypothetical protein